MSSYLPPLLHGFAHPPHLIVLVERARQGDARDVDHAAHIVAGTARSMGLTVEA